MLAHSIAHRLIDPYLTWGAAVVSVYMESDDSDRPSDDTSQEKDYSGAA